jgi:hypothetical protein
MNAPRICFGQQPCGFFPRRYLFAKIATARRLQAEHGGEIVFFYHDSDHDPRETVTILRRRPTGEAARLNFAFANKIQRKWSPLYLKRVDAAWHANMTRQLPAYEGGRAWAGTFAQNRAALVGDFCLEMYQKMGLLDGIRVVRSSDPAIRRIACDVSNFFVDVPFEGEIVRARFKAGTPVSDPASISNNTEKHAGSETGVPMLTLHEGGDSFVTLPPTVFTKGQISPTRDSRLRWMQSVVHCTHYVAGAGEIAYLRREEAPEITFINRDAIERHDEAFTEIPS